MDIVETVLNVVVYTFLCCDVILAGIALFWDFLSEGKIKRAGYVFVYFAKVFALISFSILIFFFPLILLTKPDLSLWIKIPLAALLIVLGWPASIAVIYTEVKEIPQRHQKYPEFFKVENP